VKKEPAAAIPDGGSQQAKLTRKFDNTEGKSDMKTQKQQPAHLSKGEAGSKKGRKSVVEVGSKAIRRKEKTGRVKRFLCWSLSGTRRNSKEERVQR